MVTANLWHSFFPHPDLCSFVSLIVFIFDRIYHTLVIICRQLCYAFPKCEYKLIIITHFFSYYNWQNNYQNDIKYHMGKKILTMHVNVNVTSNILAQ